MDDLDDMIDEFEQEYFQSNSKNDSKSNQKAYPKNEKKLSADIENEIDDILNDDIPIAKSRIISNNSTCKRQSTNNKCNPIYLGGTSMSLGQNTSRNKCACNKLRCTSCDFKVEIFNEYSWHKTVDYLFLRNNMPDFQRLKAKLVASKGSRSYSCQCSWKSISVPTLTSKLKNLHWVCGCH